MKDKMLELRKQGLTYAEIGKICGVSKQRVFQKIGKENKNYFKEITLEKCIYVGLRDWMNNNKCSMGDLVRKLYGECHPTNFARTRARLTSQCDEIPKKFIDKILEITGLTYEECFRKEVQK